MKTPEQLRKEFWESDIKKGGCIYHQYNEIKDVIDKKDMVWVEKKIIELKLHAIRHTKYYRKFLPEDRFPVMNKVLLTLNQEACKADSGYETPIHLSSTSGSTGTPFFVVQDYKKRMRNIADLKVLGEWCDYPSHERMLFFRVLSEKLHRTKEQEERENIFYIDSSDLSDSYLEEMRNAMVEKQPRIIFSYSSTLVELAKYIERIGTDAAAFGLKSVLTGGEGISEENRQLLERVFGAKVYRRYSNMEMGILGQDMGDGGSYRLNWGSYYFECLKIDCDEPARPGEVGRIVITDLFNYAFPMIRYDTGDLGVMEYPQDEMPRLKEIYGRSRDCVYDTEGRLLSPAKISVSMWGIHGIKQWQFIQEGKNSYVMKLNCEGDADISEIIDKLKVVLGHDAEIEIQYVEEIPVVSSNKRRAVICNYKKEN